THGGSKLFAGGALVLEKPMAEYEGIYAHFADLLDKKKSAVDGAPLQLVADAFLVGKRLVVDSFDW
ncbi:MAG TPA: gfo/Idh/MocA family oxidoreductase, partial [Roseiarcus sp.]|nr:gfo/Idh/MocA family oxidoreductase [Roseiarcus sp.]